jgi:outer membrane protein assembly factor BamB
MGHVCRLVFRTDDALDTKTGKILWSFASEGSVIDGPSRVDSVVYWGSGYRNIRPGIGNNKVYAFTLAGERDRGEHSDDHGHSDAPVSKTDGVGIIASINDVSCDSRSRQPS